MIWASRRFFNSHCMTGATLGFMSCGCYMKGLASFFKDIAWLIIFKSYIFSSLYNHANTSLYSRTKTSSLLSSQVQPWPILMVLGDFVEPLFTSITYSSRLDLLVHLKTSNLSNNFSKGTKPLSIMLVHNWTNGGVSPSCTSSTKWHENSLMQFKKLNMCLLSSNACQQLRLSRIEGLK
jgi:hypothetical protein